MKQLKEEGIIKPIETSELEKESKKQKKQIQKQIQEGKKMNRSGVLGVTLTEEASKGWEQGSKFETSGLDISHLQKAVYKQSKMFDMAEREEEEEH